MKTNITNKQWANAENTIRRIWNESDIISDVAQNAAKLLDRYESGERTVELYAEMVNLKRRKRYAERKEQATQRERERQFAAQLIERERQEYFLLNIREQGNN